MANNYVLGNRSREIERLSVQAALFESLAKNALTKAGIKKGFRCADIGCGAGHVTRMMGDLVGSRGSVVGVDIDEKYLAYCQSINKQNNVSFVHDNICESKLMKSESFDIVYSRFMFVHLKDKQNALASMVRLVKKGGVIIIQELDHAPDSWLAYPKQENVERLRKLYVKIVRKAGGDPLVGRKLYKMFIDESLDTTVECYSPCLVMGKKPFNILGHRMAETLKPQILSLHLMNNMQYKKLYQNLKKMSQDPESFVTYARFFSLIGRKH